MEGKQLGFTVMEHQQNSLIEEYSVEMLPLEWYILDQITLGWLIRHSCMEGQ